MRSVDADRSASTDLIENDRSCAPNGSWRFEVLQGSVGCRHRKTYEIVKVQETCVVVPEAQLQGCSHPAKQQTFCCAGTAKSLLLGRVAAALELSFRHYNASLLNFDDLVGFPVPAPDRTLEYLKTPAAIWGAGAVIFDEISRCRPVGID